MKLRVIAGLMLVCSFAGSARAAEKLTFHELKTRAEGARAEDCIHICAEVAMRALEEAKSQFANGSEETAKLALRDITTYAERASEAAIQKRKREKELEIELRSIGHHLDDLKHSVAFEDREDVVNVIEHLEKLRAELLKNMFEKVKKK